MYYSFIVLKTVVVTLQRVKARICNAQAKKTSLSLFSNMASYALLTSVLTTSSNYLQMIQVVCRLALPPFSLER